MNRRQFLASTAGSAFLAAPAMPTTDVWDPEGQIRRRKQIFRLWREATAGQYDATGKQIGGTNLGPDGRFRTVLAYLDGEETREKGSGILIQTLSEKWAHPSSRFYDVTAMQILIMMGQYLTGPARDKLLEFLNRSAAEAETRSIYYLGYNDNFPALDTSFAVLAGEALDRPKLRQVGMEGLERLTEMLSRRGLLTEYTSPTYTPITLLCHADIAQYSKDQRAVSLATAIERRIWLDIATHFHLPTSIMSGPRCRAYTAESVGHLYHSQMLIYQVVGDRIWMSPTRFLFPSPAPKQVVHTSVPFLKCSNVTIAASTYHLPPAVASLMLNRPYPFRVSATSEYGPLKRNVMLRNGLIGSKLDPTNKVFEYPAGELVCTTYMTEDYAVGSTTAQFLAGHDNDVFFVNFRRKTPAASLADISTIYCRYTMNDQRPGSMYIEPVPPERHMNFIICDEGRVRTVQKDSTVLVIYKAIGEIVGDYNKLYLNIIIPVFYRDPRRILVGEKEAGTLPFEAEDPDIIWIEDEILYAAFRPLILTNHGRSAAIRILKENDYLNISLYNYEGDPRKFSREQLVQTMNGFVAEIGSRTDGTFAEFQERVRSGVISDDVLRGQRVTRYSRKGVRLDLSHSIFSDGLKYAMVDGKLQSRALFQATGLDPSLLEL